MQKIFNTAAIMNIRAKPSLKNKVLENHSEVKREIGKLPTKALRMA